ncbi:recombinase family protein [Glycomyces tenuis]|uniref:recombinase family protein n=1 Tax=Glycomyces tenuis TaxID=58116 RepID=UPI0009DBEFC5|nr:recombinase family protein [Glycomyces tenuis]
MTKPRPRAVAYLRVSTTRQMETDFDPDGNSIQTQREDCQATADRYGFDLVDEYLEPGNSATSITKRPVFQRLLKRINETGDIQAVIIYRRSRAFRDEWDAAITGRELKDHGVRLISAHDYTDDTAEGQLVASVLDSINAYQSRAQGNDIKRKMAGKAARGGTPGRAKLGYLNTREGIDGRTVATIAIDPDRAPFIHTAFELFATGKHSLRSLRDALTAAGLHNRPTKAHPAGTEVAASQLEKILRDRYYLGYVVWKGQEYPGRHQPLVEPELFAQVQAVLDRRHRGTRESVWRHYLKGLLWCARCGARLVFEPARSRDGRPHFYYRCINRQGHRCDLPRLRLTVIEHAVEAHYATIAITETERTDIRAALSKQMQAQQATTKELRRQLRTELTRLDHREDAYLDLVGDPAWPNEKLTRKIQEIRLERDRLHQRLAEAETTDYATAERRITALLDLLTDPRKLYRSMPDDHRQAFNDLCFDKLYVDADTPDDPAITSADHAAAYAPLGRYCGKPITNLSGNRQRDRSFRHGPSQSAECSNERSMVGLTGLEPATP